MEDYSGDLPKTELVRKQIRSTILFALALVAAALLIGSLFRLGPTPPDTGILTYVGDFPSDHIWFNTSEPLSVYNQLSQHVSVLFFCELSALSDLQYLSRLEELDEYYSDLPLAVIVILVSSETDVSELTTTVETWGVDFPIIIDSSELVSQRFRVSTYPAVLVLDSKATVSTRFYAGWEEADLQGIVGDLFEQGTAMRNLSTTPFEPDGGTYFPEPDPSGS